MQLPIIDGRLEGSLTLLCSCALTKFVVEPRKSRQLVRPPWLPCQTLLGARFGEHTNNTMSLGEVSSDDLDCGSGSGSGRVHMLLVGNGKERTLGLNRVGLDYRIRLDLNADATMPDIVQG